MVQILYILSSDGVEWDHLRLWMQDYVWHNLERRMTWEKNREEVAQEASVDIVSLSVHVFCM